jgi:hypothetical protein
MPKATGTPTTPTRRALFRGIGLTSIAAGLAAVPTLADPLLASICRKPGPCPCEAPCIWGEQALDALRRDGWPLRAGSAVA